MGEWWFQETGLPLPLGGNVVRKDLGPELTSNTPRPLRDSIAYGLQHRVGALDHAMQYARGLDRSKADTFVGMYVNDWTLDYGDRGRQAVRLFLQRGVEAGLVKKAVTVEFVDWRRGGRFGSRVSVGLGKHPLSEAVSHPRIPA